MTKDIHGDYGEATVMQRQLQEQCDIKDGRKAMNNRGNHGSIIRFKTGCEWKEKVAREGVDRL